MSTLSGSGELPSPDLVGLYLTENNVGKGSWQNGSVTLGKGLALRAGSAGLWSEAEGDLAYLHTTGRGASKQTAGQVGHSLFV